jgi:uncharacterized protein (DUF927 family)
VDKDYGKRQQIVRVEFNRFEKNWEREVLKLGKKATELNKAGKEKEASALLSGFNKRCVAEAIKIASALKEEFEESNIKALKTCEEQERCWE